MKKLFTFLASSFFAASMVAQCVPAQLAEPKFDPDPETIDCFRKGNPVNQVFNFKIPATAGAFTIQYMKIDSVTNLPDGLTATLNKGFGAQYAGNEDGCVTVSGTSNDASGQYRLGLYVAIKVTVLPTELKGDLYTVAKSQNVDSAEKYILWLRLTGTTETCPCIDKSKTTVNDFTAYTGSEANCATSTTVNEIASSINGLNIIPNPFSSVATVSFSSEVEGSYTARITDLVGKEVMRSTENVTLGTNNISISRNNLPSGVYFFSLSNGSSAVTKRFVIE